jgi:4-diphosphocytidyl-2-C-methyl-D-erythritol kinase
MRATAFTKLTLSLRITGTRPDGFHELDALVVSLGQPQDSITVELTDTPGVEFALEADDTDVPDDGENLAARAARAVLEHAGVIDRGVRIGLHKRIPAGAGLGGGSADAAAALLLTRAALGLDIDDVAVFDLAAGLGADVPFCLAGGAARVRGLGDVLDHVELPLGLPFLLAVPDFRLATSAVYAAWDALGGPRSERAVAVPRVADDLVNDLEPAAEHVEPRLAEFRRALEDAAGRPPLLAGSGSAYAVPMEDAKALPDRAAEVSARFGREVVAAATVSRGVRRLD